MQDGYYLSIYSHIGDLAHLVNVSLRHDQAICLWHKRNENICLFQYWELERFSRQKHHSISFFNTDHAVKLISSLLSSINLSMKDVIEVWGTPGISTSIESWRGRYAKFPYHSVMHLYSSLLSDTEIFNTEKIIALAVDGAPDTVIDAGVGNKDFYVGCFSDRGVMKLFSVPSPGVLWALMRRRYGLNEGTLMALGGASLSEACIDTGTVIPIYNAKDIIRASEWFDDLAAKVDAITEMDAGILMNGLDKRFSIDLNRISMLVKIIQQQSIAMLEYAIDKIIDKYQVDASETYLSLSGGYALNCPTNSYLMCKYDFKGFLATPCPNDSGIAMGIGLYEFHSRMGRFDFRLPSAYCGCGDQSLKSVVADARYADRLESLMPMQVEQVIDDLLQSPIVWFQGRAEIGPRALGNRSLLADPRTLSSRDTLNLIKQRQWWRPVAPVVLETEMHDWFEEANSSPYMLHTFRVKDNRRDDVPAICHLDQTARVQTLRRDHNPLLHDLLSAFSERTGVPILCNTSLNDRGEPIINTTREAIDFAIKKRMPILYINGWRIALRVGPRGSDLPPSARRLERDFRITLSDQAAMERDLNPGQLSRYDLMVYYHTPRLHRYDPRDLSDADKLRKLIARIKRKFGDRIDFQFLDLWHFIEHNHEVAS